MKSIDMSSFLTVVKIVAESYDCQVSSQDGRQLHNCYLFQGEPRSLAMMVASHMIPQSEPITNTPFFQTRVEYICYICMLQQIKIIYISFKITFNELINPKIPKVKVSTKLLKIVNKTKEQEVESEKQFTSQLFSGTKCLFLGCSVSLEETFQQFAWAWS